MSYEIELKFPLTDKDRLLAALKAVGAEEQPQLQQCDRYFNHPARDFGQTNEAFRIRQSGGQTRLTYKGPLLDEATKTRREIELSLADGQTTAEQMAELVQGIGVYGSPLRQENPHALSSHLAGPGHGSHAG